MTIHPLDRDYDQEEPESGREAADYAWRSTKVDPWLRVNVYALIGIAILVVISAIFVSNLPYPSAQWNVALALNQLGMLLLLVAFLGLLVNYHRIRSSARRVRATAPWFAWTGGLNLTRARRQRRILVAVSSLLWLTMVVLICWEYSTGNVTLAAIFRGLGRLLTWITVIVLFGTAWRFRGYVLALAVGALPPLMTYALMRQLGGLSRGFAPNQRLGYLRPDQLDMLARGLSWTLALLAGLACLMLAALLVRLVQSFSTVTTAQADAAGRSVPPEPSSSASTRGQAASSMSSTYSNPSSPP